ncbi:uncharacterized protein ATNIH1004_008267 [Aspergillus tanneri]|uniref:Uncharacterized protein n=1 Tax=Aspergillus tanneri TaxID=1220188 RepID=A0A5M9MHX3_9EURO|nr:uncharacterized protein ATNIH1004_008267 [Aspergillus tanneri]KAA8644069.1 hypothetical protein ATNIH1004_008267 [Aspergillus tanneri]
MEEIQLESCQYKTYADYIEDQYEDNYHRYSWLVNFLRKGHPSSPNSALSFPVRIFLLDSSNECLTSRKFSIKRDSLLDPLFVNTLKEAQCNRQTRLILVQYRHFENINPSFIDTLGLWCGLDPAFFSVHFECDFDRIGQITHCPTRSLPSEKRCLQIITDEWSFMTATWKISKNEHTLVVLERDDHLGSADHIPALHDKLTKHISPDEIARLNRYPADYLFPYVREAARRAASVSAQFTPFRAGIESNHDQNLGVKWDIIQRNQQAMVSSLNSLSKFLACPEINAGSDALNLSSLLFDYRELIQETNRISADIQMLLQQQANLASIQQARRGLEQTDSVRR